MTATLRNLPDMPGRRARITAARQSEDQAKATALAVTRAKRMMDDPRGYSDEQIATACAWFMNQSGKDRDDDGNVYYQRADELLFAINRRQQIARNRAQFQGTLTRIADPDPDDQETSLRVAMRHQDRWPDIIAGAVALVGFGWAVLVLVGVL